MQIQQAIHFDDRGRDGLATLLDAVLPGTGALPPGRQVGAHLDLLDRVLRADPDLIPAVTRAGNRAAAVESCTLDDLGDWVGEDRERVVFALHAAYYMSAEVRSVLGYPGQGRRPIAQATPDEVASDELIAPVVNRGPIYVPTPA